MKHHNDKALFRKFVQQGKAYADGIYDFTFDHRYLIYHVVDVGLRYIALDSMTGLGSEVTYLPFGSTPYTPTTYYLLIPKILYSIKYTGDSRYLEQRTAAPSETIDFIFRVVLPYHGYAIREEQIKLAQNMYEGFRFGRVSINEAEVGTGKTMATLLRDLWQDEHWGEIADRSPLQPRVLNCKKQS